MMRKRRKKGILAKSGQYFDKIVRQLSALERQGGQSYNYGLLLFGWGNAALGIGWIVSEVPRLWSPDILLVLGWLLIYYGFVYMTVITAREGQIFAPANWARIKNGYLTVIVLCVLITVFATETTVSRMISSGAWCPNRANYWVKLMPDSENRWLSLADWIMGLLCLAALNNSVLWRDEMLRQSRELQPWQEVF